MFNDQDLRELLEFSAPEQVLSVFLNTDPQEGNADAYRLRLRTMLKEVKLPEDVAAVEQYFSQAFDWSGRSVAVFSCAAQQFFRAYPLAIPLRNQVHVGERASIKPLTNLLDNYGGYGVVLVDQQGARLFHFHLGELREQEGVLGESVKRIKRGGSSSLRGRRGGSAGQTRAVEETVGRNMKDSAEFAAEFFEQNHVRRILIGGTGDNIVMFRNELPKAWQSLVVGVFPVSMNATHTEVLGHALEIGQQNERQREQRLVENIITNAAKGNQAVAGLGATLEMVNAKRVQTLVIADGYRQSGYRCPDCGILSVKADQKCEGCGRMVESIEDVVEEAVNVVLRHRGGVEVVQENLVFEKAGSVGAVLRY